MKPEEWEKVSDSCVFSSHFPGNRGKFGVAGSPRLSIGRRFCINTEHAYLIFVVGANWVVKQAKVAAREAAICVFSRRLWGLGKVTGILLVWSDDPVLLLKSRTVTNATALRARRFCSSKMAEIPTRLVAPLKNRGCCWPETVLRRASNCLGTLVLSGSAGGKDACGSRSWFEERHEDRSELQSLAEETVSSRGVTVSRGRLAVGVFPGRCHFFGGCAWRCGFRGDAGEPQWVWCGRASGSHGGKHGGAIGFDQHTGAVSVLQLRQQLDLWRLSFRSSERGWAGLVVRKRLSVLR